MPERSTTPSERLILDDRYYVQRQDIQLHLPANQDGSLLSF